MKSQKYQKASLLIQAAKTTGRSEIRERLIDEAIVLLDGDTIVSNFKEDDALLGAIQKYVETRLSTDRICVKEIWEKALCKKEKLSKKDAARIMSALYKSGACKPVGRQRHREYGTVICFIPKRG